MRLAWCLEVSGHPSSSPRASSIDWSAGRVEPSLPACPRRPCHRADTAVVRPVFRVVLLSHSALHHLFVLALSDRPLVGRQFALLGIAPYDIVSVVGYAPSFLLMTCCGRHAFLVTFIPSSRVDCGQGFSCCFPSCNCSQFSAVVLQVDGLGRFAALRRRLSGASGVSTFVLVGTCVVALEALQQLQSTFGTGPGQQ